jgi:hexosaminidase
MKCILVGIIVLSLAGRALAAIADEPAIIPQPQTMERLGGEFTLTAGTRIFADSGLVQTADLLAQRLRQSTGYRCKVTRDGTPVSGGILLTTNGADSRLGAEGYELHATTNAVVIRAPTPAGLFYRMQTLLQLLPPEFFQPTALRALTGRFPAWRSRTPRVLSGAD